MNTGFYGIFKDKLKKQKAELKKELEKAKSDRRKGWLRQQIRETKILQETVKQMEKKLDIKTCCPKCGCEL